MQNAKTLHTAAAIITAAMVFLFSLVSGGAVEVRAAVNAATKYTEVLTDLQTDESFNAADYKVNEKDYSMQVIQIAESSDGELFVYVYRPNTTRGLIATSINLSTETGEKLNYENYMLYLLSSNGVFDKYILKDFKVLKTSIRYYDISSIYRAYDKQLDGGELNNGNEINETVYKVGRQYTAYEHNGQTYYECKYPEYVTITDKYIGYMRYTSTNVLDYYKFISAGLFSGAVAVDSYYIAFACNYPIDKLLSAKVYYVSQEYVATALIIKVYGNETKRSVPLRYDDKVLLETDFGLDKHRYEWDRIQSVSDFKKKETLSEEAEEKLKGKEWILRFAEFQYLNCYMLVEELPYLNSGTKVNDVTILQLKFEMQGKTYNLGVIDNKQSPGANQKPDNTKPGFDFFQWLAELLGVSKRTAKLIFFGVIAVIALLILLPILYIFVPAVKVALHAVGKVLYYVLYGVWWLISAPFRGIAALIRKKKDNSSGGKE